VLAAAPTRAASAIHAEYAAATTTMKMPGTNRRISPPIKRIGRKTRAGK
jgi:hypothetical protein